MQYHPAPPLQAQRLVPPNPPWGKGEALWGIGIAVGVVVVLLIIVGVLAVAFDLDADDNTTLAISLVAQAFANFVILGMVFLRVRRHGGSLRDFGFRAVDWGRSWWVVIAFVIGSYATILGYDVLVDAIGLDGLRPEGNIDDDIKDSVIVFAIAAVFAILIAPLTEEMFFRGLVFGGLSNGYSFWVGLVISSLLFGLVHGQLTLLIPFSIIGGYLALAYSYTRSLWGSISCHLTFNALSVIGLALS